MEESAKAQLLVDEIWEAERRRDWAAHSDDEAVEV